jgi:hypothetical protein
MCARQELLEERWQREVRKVTDLAVARYSLDDTDPQSLWALRQCESELAAARYELRAIENELRQLAGAAT